MRSRVTILLFALVAVTVAVLLLLGLHLAEREGRMVQLQLQELSEARLQDLDAVAAQVVGEVERSLLELTRSPGRDPENLRGWTRRHPLVRQVFRLDASGALVHPVEPGLSDDERDFVHRTEAIWKQQAVLHAPPPAEASAASSAKVVPRWLGSVKGDSLGGLAARKSHGFVSWYWEEGLHLLFWRRDEGGGVIGLEVERVVLLSRLVSRLPSGTSEEGRLGLVDARGDTVYQWGAHEPEEGARPFAELSLSPPLESYRLRLFPSARQLAGLERSGLPWALGLSGLALSLLLFFSYAMREHRRELEDAEQRVGFVTRVSHELKTPLTNIRLYTELLEDALAEDPQAERHRQVILEESERLGRLIRNVLSFSRRGEHEAARRTAPLVCDELLGRVVEQFRPALERRGFQIELDLQAPEPISLDPDAFEQILGNLLGNAEKYGTPGRWVAVRSRQSEAETRISVEDRGPGVPETLREQIFLPFFRASDRMNEGVTGTGIGLTIARELARAMGGELRCEAGDGGGARFVLRLPKALAAADGGAG